MKGNSIGIITARGGSKRIPGKNIKTFCGKPMIQYSIEAALESRIFDEVMVSTDDEEIKAIALKCGARIPFMRSIKNSDDNAATHEVLVEVLEEYKKRGKEFEYACCIYPTAPFITSEKLINGMKLLLENRADSVVPVVPFSFPPLRSFIVKEGLLEYKWPDKRLARSQDLESMYHDSGQFYFFNVSNFLKSKSLIMDKTIPFILSEMEVQDIDNESDWKLAELKYQQMVQKRANNL